MRDAAQCNPVRKRLSCLRLWQEVSHKAEKLAKVEENSEAQNLHNFPTLCNPWISSAMAMAMSICRTLCIRVYPFLGHKKLSRHLHFRRPPLP